MNGTRLSYKGTVKVKIKINNKYYTIYKHNNGTEYLQKSFCKFISGNYGGDSDIPQLIDLRKEDGYGNWTTYLNQELGLTGKTYLKTTDAELGLDDVWVARFTAAIPYSVLIDPKPIAETDTGHYRLYLYSSFDVEEQSYHDLAYIDISAEALSQITPGTQALVEWSMQLLDYIEPESSNI